MTKKLRVVVLNLENLFILLDSAPPDLFLELDEQSWQSLSISTVENKPLKACLDLAREILFLNPDLLILSEIGGRESLENFNRYFLRNRYRSFLLEGNSTRGIDVGFLLLRDLPFECDLISHRDRLIDFLYPHEKLSQQTGFKDLVSADIISHRFSRDVLELRLFQNEKPQIPFLIALSVHLKSPWDRQGYDPGGRDRREAELEKLIEIYREIRGTFAQSVPVIVGGDFNGVAAGSKLDPEFTSIAGKTDWRDALDIAGVPEHERYTHMQVHRNSSQNRQIDYLFLSSDLHNQLQSGRAFVHRYRDERGVTYPIAKTLAEKKYLPSDHFPLVADLFF